MRSGRFSSSSFSVRRALIPLALITVLALAACGGGSSDKTTVANASTSASSGAGTSTSASTSASTSVTTTAAATAASTAAATAASTAAATAASTAAATTAPSTTATAAATSATTPEATTASSGGGAANTKLQQQVADAWDKVTSYKVVLSVYDSNSTTPTLSTTIETMKPDKQHTVSNIAGTAIESISIGNDSYVKFGNTWQKAPDSGGANPPVSADDAIKDFANPSPDEKLVQKDDETLDGVKTEVFQVTATDGSVATIWIGKDDHLPRKSIVSIDSGHVEVIYSDYGKDFGIKAPI